MNQMNFMKQISGDLAIHLFFLRFSALVCKKQIFPWFFGGKHVHRSSFGSLKRIWRVELMNEMNIDEVMVFKGDFLLWAMEGLPEGGLNEVVVKRDEVFLHDGGDE